MNRIKIFILFLFLLALQFHIFGTNTAPIDEKYYWFYIKIDKTFDKETGINQINIRNIGSEIESGTFNEFLSSHQNGLKFGKIAIGPFSEKDKCQDAQSYYRNSERYNGPSEEAASFGEDNTYTFFYMKPIGDNLSEGIMFERIPSRVTSGNIEDFMYLLIEGLSFDKLAIGPFDNYELAEKAKFAFVRNGETGLNTKADSVKNQALNLMAKKWKSLNMQIVKETENKELNKTTYRFNTKFPRKYFVPDAYQIITIKAYYNKPADNSSNSFTLQGEDVIDNNPVVSNTLGMVYINFLNFDKYKDIKVMGFSIEGFLYNDSEIIELEPVFVSIK
jgi:hypothetical protein